MDSGTQNQTRGSKNSRRLKVVLLFGSVLTVLAVMGVVAVTTFNGKVQANTGEGFTRHLNGKTTLEPLELHTPEVHLKLKNQTDMIMARFEVEVDGYTPWHSHPGPVLVTVAEGQFKITRYTKKDGCTEDIYGPGEGFIGPANVVHLGSNEGDAKVVGYVTFLNVPVGGLPLDDGHEVPNCG